MSCSKEHHQAVNEHVVTAIVRATLQLWNSHSSDKAEMSPQAAGWHNHAHHNYHN